MKKVLFFLSLLVVNELVAMKGRNNLMELVGTGGVSESELVLRYAQRLELVEKLPIPGTLEYQLSLSAANEKYAVLAELLFKEIPEDSLEKVRAFLQIFSYGAKATKSFDRKLIKRMIDKGITKEYSLLELLAVQAASDNTSD